MRPSKVLIRNDSGVTKRLGFRRADGDNARARRELDHRTPVANEQAYYVDQDSPLPAPAGQETG